MTKKGQSVSALAFFARIARDITRL